jgi:hypothetical protein
LVNWSNGRSVDFKVLRFELWFFAFRFKFLAIY